VELLKPLRIFSKNHPSSHNHYVDIFLDGLYDIKSVRIINSVKDTVYYHYRIYVSPNGDNFTKIAYKSDNTPAVPEGILHDVNSACGAAGISQVRVQISYVSEQIPINLPEVQIYGEKTSGHIPPKKTRKMTEFENTIWAERFNKFKNDPFYASQRLLSEMSDMVCRVLGDAWKDSFVFEIIDGKGMDTFELEYISEKVVIRGPNGVSLASGFNAYLKRFAYVNYNPMFESNLNMPSVLPSFSGKIIEKTAYTKRYALNFCTFSYTMAFWGWQEFERYLDWAAMNGINLMLQIVGQEEVIKRFLEEFGYTLDDVLDYISGPGYFAWFYMQNMTGWGGPLPLSWFEQRAELGRKIHDRMQTFGIQPVLQGFSGMVPNNFREVFNASRSLKPGDDGYLPQFADEADPRNSIAPQGEWCGYKRPDMIRTISESGNFFEEAAKIFYAAQTQVFGNISSYYAVDPFHEGGNRQGMDRSEVYKSVQSAMVCSDSAAVWVIQQWGRNVSLETLRLLDKGHTLVLDLNAEMKPENEPMEKTGMPWIWNMLHNFGGRMGIFGDLPAIRELPNIYENKKHMLGIGTTMESYGNCGIMYDLMADITWQNKSIDVYDYLRSYVHCRYGDFDGEPEPNALAGWNIISKTALGKKTLYVQGPPESVINARPTTDFISASTWGHSTYQYDPRELEAAIPHFMLGYAHLKDKQTFIYDFVELLAQVLSTKALEIYREMTAAFGEKDANKFNGLSGRFLKAIGLMDDMLGISPRFGVGHWIHDARNMLPEMDDFTRDLFEFNARALISTWGGQENLPLSDYSNRQWSGLTNNLYLKRWEKFIYAHNAVLAGGSPSALPSAMDYFQMEWEWANLKSDEGDCYPVDGSGADLSLLAQRVMEEFVYGN